MLHQI